MDDSIKEKQIDLEIKITYLEDTVGELNSVVYKQQLQIDKLEDKIKRLSDKIEEVEASSGEDLPHVKPPHY